jgi:exodeoxyribonuclease-1
MSKEFLNTCRRFIGNPPNTEVAKAAYQGMSDEYKSFVAEDVFIAYTQNPSQGSFMMHDYEGGGVSGIKSGATQFAGVRVNMDLVPIDLPIDVYCKPNIDRLPSLEAVLITRISPLYCLNNGVSEFEFFKMINEEMSFPNTCVAGFNSVGYDDVMSRSGFYANLLPVYDRENKNGNSRWDMYRVVQAYYALRPDGIVWPPGKDGNNASLRLEDIAKANNIVQENAHNAVDDVLAMIDVCRLLKGANEQLWQYLFTNRSKHYVNDCVRTSLSNSKPLIYINSYAGVAKRLISVVMPLSVPLADKNEVAFVDLSGDFEQLLNTPPDKIKELLFAPKEVINELSVSRPAIGKFKVNQLPIVMPFSAIKDDSVRSGAGIDLELIKANFAKCYANLGRLEELIMSVYSDPDYGDDNPYIEDTVYSAGFPAKCDKVYLDAMHSMPIEKLAEEFTFFKPNMNELKNRLLCLHLPESVPTSDYEDFRKLAIEKLTTPKDDRVTIESVEHGISEHESCEEEHVQILLRDYKEYLVYLKKWMAEAS